MARSAFKGVLMLLSMEDTGYFLKLDEADMHFRRIVDHDLNPIDSRLLQASKNKSNFLITLLDKTPLINKTSLSGQDDVEDAYIAFADYRAMKYAEFGLDTDGYNAQKAVSLKRVIDFALEETFKFCIDKVPYNNMPSPEVLMPEILMIENNSKPLLN
tara:strand:- start:71 stop:544 length:474 start_codon:yes stop_codon:yes gene_type:complete